MHKTTVACSRVSSSARDSDSSLTVRIWSTYFGIDRCKSASVNIHAHR